MNAVINFLQDIFSGSSANDKPVGLNGFRETEPKKVLTKKKIVSNKDIKISDLMRRH